MVNEHPSIIFELAIETEPNGDNGAPGDGQLGHNTGPGFIHTAHWH